MKPPKKNSLVPVTGEWSRSLVAQKLAIGAIQHSFKGGTYDLYGDQLLENEDAVAYIYEKAKKGSTIRVWTQGDFPVEAMVKVKPYIHHWCIYCPSLDETRYREQLGTDELSNLFSRLDQYQEEGVSVHIHVPVTRENLSWLPDYVSQIRTKNYRALLHYQTSSVSKDERQSIHYFQRYSNIHILPCNRPYPIHSYPLPLGQALSFDLRLLKATFMAGMARIRTRLGV